LQVVIRYPRLLLDAQTIQIPQSAAPRGGEAAHERSGPMRHWWAAALVTAPLCSAIAGTTITVAARRHGPVVELVASAPLHAPVALVWSTLTDYDCLWRFIPGLRRSRVLWREGTTAFVEEQGEARIWRFSMPLEVVLASSERPPYRIDVRLVSGNLRRLDGSYRIAPRADGTLLLSWTGRVEPDFWLPPYIGQALVRSSVADQFGGMVHEIERRDGMRR
jgi:hypothetical protein